MVVKKNESSLWINSSSNVAGVVRLIWMSCRRRTDGDYNCTTVAQSEMKRKLGKPEHRWKDNMIIYRLILDKKDLRAWNED